MLDLIHLSNNKTLNLTEEYGRSYLQLKPNGIWYSIDDQWKDWLSANDCPIPKYQHDLHIDIDELLIIDKLSDLNKIPLKKNFDLSDRCDWEKLKQTYKGLYIPEYFQLKNDLFFNEEFKFNCLGVFLIIVDVSGGCIWDLSAIKSYSTKGT
jgi:hypothetical protein